VVHGDLEGDSNQDPLGVMIKPNSDAVRSLVSVESLRKMPALVVLGK
jgi:hypothetical protein